MDCHGLKHNVAGKSWMSSRVNLPMRRPMSSDEGRQEHVQASGIVKKRPNFTKRGTGDQSMHNSNTRRRRRIRRSHVEPQFVRQYRASFGAPDGS